MAQHVAYRTVTVDGLSIFYREAEVHILDAGHFALDTAADEIAALVRDVIRSSPEHSRPGTPPR